MMSARSRRSSSRITIVKKRRRSFTEMEIQWFTNIETGCHEFRLKKWDNYFWVTSDHFWGSWSCSSMRKSWYHRKLNIHIMNKYCKITVKLGYNKLKRIDFRFGHSTTQINQVIRNPPVISNKNGWHRAVCYNRVWLYIKY